MAVTKDRLLVAGAEFVFDTRSDGDVYEPQASDPPERWMWDLAAAGGRYFMAGAFFGDLDHPGDLDFAVRAYAYR